MFCWGMNDDGSFAVGVGSHQPCGDQYLAPIIALGVEMLPAGGLSAAALLNGTARKTIGPLIEHCLKHNWSGVHVDFEEGKVCTGKPGCVSESLYATFLSALGQRMRAHGLVMEVDVGETFPVQDIYENAMDSYFKAVEGAPAGALAMMGPTYLLPPPPNSSFNRAYYTGFD
jgi:hypothetical protein